MGNMDNSVEYSTVTITVKTGNKTKSIVIHKAQNAVFETNDDIARQSVRARLMFDAYLDDDGVYYSGSDRTDEQK